MATVFLAQDVKHARPVALKVLDPELGASLAADRFLREIKIAAKLQHPHIVPLYDSGVADDLLYYVMPYIEGESLRARIAKQRQLRLETALQITGETADALDYAHRAGVIHRDIKPENILLSGGHAMVADFGIALAITTAGGQALTSTGVAIGTPVYMSPEQATGDYAIDARTDIYSLGCVLYEMLSGLPPYVGPTPVAILAKQAAGRVEPPRKFRNDVPRPVERAVLKALASEPADRHVTAEEFSRALVGPDRRTAKKNWARLVSWKTLVAATAVLAVAVLGTIILSQPGEPEPSLGFQAFREGHELHDLGLNTGQTRVFEDAIARFHMAARLDTNLIAPSMLWAAWGHLNLGQLAAADGLVQLALPRRDRLSPSDIIMLDLLVSAHLRGDLGTALQVARQVGTIDLPVIAFRYNRPREAVQALDSLGPIWYDYWYFLTASHHMLGDHEDELSAARVPRLSEGESLRHVLNEVRALGALGRVEEVNGLISEALLLPPESGWWGTQETVISAGAIELRAHGNRDASIDVAERLLGWLNGRPAQEAASAAHRSQLAQAYSLAEQWSEARVIYEQLVRENPGETSYLGALGALAARRGDREEALRLSDAIVGTADRYEFGAEPYRQAGIAAQLGERERAVNLLREAFAQGFQHGIYDPHANMDFEPLRDYPPFQELVRPKG
jgi:tetratricopeptide (TPR) repeat protein